MSEEYHPRSVTILGKAMTGHECPFTDQEIWGVNNVYSHSEHAGKRITKLFAFDILPPEYIAGMKASGVPICSWQDYADEKYPLQEVQAEFKTDYFTNTVSYMLALCALWKVPKISIYGVDTCFGAAYAQENRGVEYWIGRAQERGCEVYVPSQSQLMKTISGNLYGHPDHCNVGLYLHERINLLNILPKKGQYSECLKSQNAWWVLFPKQDESWAHGLIVQGDPAGNHTFTFREIRDDKGNIAHFPDGHPIHGQDGKPILQANGKPVLAKTGAEWLSDTHMPPETWDYIRGLLIDLEKKGELPYGCISIYEKLVLAQPPGGN